MAKQTVAERTSAFEAKRAASAARIVELLQKSTDEGRTLEAGSPRSTTTWKLKSRRSTSILFAFATSRR